MKLRTRVDVILYQHSLDCFVRIGKTMPGGKQFFTLFFWSMGALGKVNFWMGSGQYLSICYFLPAYTVKIIRKVYSALTKMD